jgi:asparagine N-glycosylation enzyme membrane subunit Stt3
LILLGLLFEFGVLGRGANRFVPAGILLVIGTVLLACNIFGYDKMNYLWPAFVFAPGFGLFQAYLVKKSKGLLTASMVLIVLSAIFFTAAFFHVSWPRVLFGIVLIIFGVVILLKSLRRKVE